jgi:DNA-binding NtrC family response regulator
MTPKAQILSGRATGSSGPSPAFEVALPRHLDVDLASRCADPALRPLIRALLPAAAADGPILLVGESGVGKEYFARRIHAIRWGRGAGFLALLATGVTVDRLVEHLDGRAAARGIEPRRRSIYIRSIELLAPEAQRHLAAWLTRGPRVPRTPPFLLAGTQGDVAARAKAGLFDHALAAEFYRHGPLAVPPLRERREDRLILATQILSHVAEEAGRPIPWLARDVWERVLRGTWKGNVREMSNSLRQAVIEMRDESRATHRRFAGR